MSRLPNDQTPNVWEKTVERDGKITEEERGTFDPFKDLLKEDGFSTVSCSLTRSADYGNLKVTFFVSARCDQNEAAINEAGKRVFMKAAEFCDDAAEVLGMNRK